MSKKLNRGEQIEVRYCVVPDLPMARRSLCGLTIPCQDCLVSIQENGGEEFFEKGLAPAPAEDVSAFDFKTITSDN